MAWTEPVRRASQFNPHQRVAQPRDAVAPVWVAMFVRDFRTGD
jgi:hypothetical protein